MILLSNVLEIFVSINRKQDIYLERTGGKDEQATFNNRYSKYVKATPTGGGASVTLTSTHVRSYRVDGYDVARYITVPLFCQ